MAWNPGAHKVLLDMDSLLAVQILNKVRLNEPFHTNVSFNLVQTIKMRLNGIWVVRIHYVYREGN